MMFDNDTEIQDGIAAFQFITWDQTPKFRDGTITKAAYKKSLLEAIQKCRHAHHLHPAGGHNKSASKLQRIYDTL
jgi:surface antigen